VGRPAFPFIGQERAMIIDGRREKNETQRNSFMDAGSSFFLCVGPTDMAGGDRDNPTPGACLLTLTGLRWASVR
jgi:hypothetical protein